MEIVVVFLLFTIGLIMTLENLSLFTFTEFFLQLGICSNKNCSFFSERLACVFITFVLYRNGGNYRAKKEKKVSEPRQEHLFFIFNCHVNDGARTKKNG